MRARVSVRGSQAECFLNGERLFTGKTDAHATGCVGLMTFGSSYRVRNILVTDPLGRVLLQGLPDMDSFSAPK
jgi:hypothetical protein